MKMNRPNIQFKTKIRQVYNVDGTPAYEDVRMPKITRMYCDMEFMRRHKRIGSFANSDMFLNLLNQYLKKQGFPVDSYNRYIRLDQPLPEGMTINPAGFLAIVSINLIGE